MIFDRTWQQEKNSVEIPELPAIDQHNSILEKVLLVDLQTDTSNFFKDFSQIYNTRDGGKIFKVEKLLQIIWTRNKLLKVNQITTHNTKILFNYLQVKSFS